MKIDFQPTVTADDDRASFVERREGANLQLTRKVFDGGLTRPDPLTTNFRDVTIHLVIEGTPPYSIPRFQNQEGLVAGQLQVTGGGQTGQPRTDNDDIQHVVLPGRHHRVT
ncbi:hypothetical protein FQZ97_1256150 [compost metagenome]